LDSVHQTLQVHTIALAGLRDLIARLQDDTSQQTRQFLGVVEGLRVAFESERHGRESIQGELRGQLEETRARLGELRAEGGRLQERMEFIREETMFELRVVANTAAKRASAPPSPGEIVNLAKYEAMAAAGTVRLNVGCGHVTPE